MDYFSLLIGFALGSVFMAWLIKRKLKKAQSSAMFQEQRRPKKPFNDDDFVDVVIDDVSPDKDVIDDE